MRQIRQGDVLLIRVDDGTTIDTEGEHDRDQHGRLVLAYGEASGHAHAIRAKHVSARRVKAEASALVADLLLEVRGKSCNLRHEYADGRQADHDTVRLDPGRYLVRRQREHSPAGERTVSD